MLDKAKAGFPKIGHQANSMAEGIPEFANHCTAVLGK